MSPAATLAAYIGHACKVDGLSLKPNSPGVGEGLDDRFHDSGPLQSLDFSPQNAEIPTAPYDSNFGNARLDGKRPNKVDYLAE